MLSKDNTFCGVPELKVLILTNWTKVDILYIGRGNIKLSKSQMEITRHVSLYGPVIDVLHVFNYSLITVVISQV